MMTRQPLFDLDILSVNEMKNFKKFINEEIFFFTESVKNLQEIATKFRRCIITIEIVKEGKTNQEALIPLSDSVYVNGRILDLDSFLVDIGTGYIVQMTPEQASDHYCRKLDFLNNEINITTKETLPERQHSLKLVLAALQHKMNEVSLNDKTNSSI